MRCIVALIMPTANAKALVETNSDWLPKAGHLGRSFLMTSDHESSTDLLKLIGSGREISVLDARRFSEACL